MLVFCGHLAISSLPQGRRYPARLLTRVTYKSKSTSANPNPVLPDEVSRTLRRVRHNHPHPSHPRSRGSHGSRPAGNHPDHHGKRFADPGAEDPACSLYLDACTKPRRNPPTRFSKDTDGKPASSQGRNPRSALLGGEHSERTCGKAFLAETPPDEWRRSIHEDPV